VKKLIGLNIFQTAVIMMYVSFGRVAGGTAPILFPHGDDHGGEGDHGAEAAVDAAEHPADAITEVAEASGHAFTEAGQAAFTATQEAVHAAGFEAYSNPLPHVLMLTAIVVGVATLALGLALVVRIQEAYGTIEEDEINQMDLVS
ncbi:MAG: cation:proton antiporter subunit C, partial [Gemmatimonadota bacterium]